MLCFWYSHHHCSSSPHKYLYLSTNQCVFTIPSSIYHSSNTMCKPLSRSKSLLPSSQDHPLSYSLLKDLFPQIVFSHPSCWTDGRVKPNSKADSFPNAKPISTDWLQYSLVGCISQVFPCSDQRTAGQSPQDTAARNLLLGNSLQTLLSPDFTVSCYGKQVICLSSVAEWTISQYKYASEP